jgi:hypothetical protein
MSPIHLSLPSKDDLENIIQKLETFSVLIQLLHRTQTLSLPHIPLFEAILQPSLGHTSLLGVIEDKELGQLVSVAGGFGVSLPSIEMMLRKPVAETGESMDRLFRVSSGRHEGRRIDSLCNQGYKGRYGPSIYPLHDEGTIEEFLLGR